MSFLQLTLRCSRDQAGLLEDTLLDMGAVSVTLVDAEDEPLFEPGVGETPLWSELIIKALFPQDSDQAALESVLNTAWQAGPELHCAWEQLPDQDWVRAWLDDFKPMRFGNTLWVCPSWWQTDPQFPPDADSWIPSPEDADVWAARNQELLDAMQSPDAVVLKLDPGLAFGTGTHATTSLCLQWLDAHPPAGMTVVDYGCGSGILGIASLLLGAERVYGIDNDPQALLATADNCHKNHLDSANFPIYLPAAFARELAEGRIRPVDGMLANILAGTLIQLAELLSLQVKTGGWILLSGILHDQADSVLHQYAPWFRDFNVVQQDDWVSISAIRQ